MLKFLISFVIKNKNVSIILWKIKINIIIVFSIQYKNWSNN